MEFEKFRLRFRKTGLLRLVSHHDLMRVLERMLRRAGLPFRSTAGFHPHPRVVFALSLPLGIEGLDEVVEIELTQPLAREEILSRLQSHAPQGLEFTSIRRVACNATAQASSAVYAVALPPEREAALHVRCRELLDAPACTVVRDHRKKGALDIRPFIADLRIDGGRLVLEFLVTPFGTARADEVLTLLGAGDLLENGAVLQRVQLLLQDENESDHHPPASSDGRAAGLAQAVDHALRITHT